MKFSAVITGPALSTVVSALLLFGCAGPTHETASSLQVLLSRQAEIGEEIIRIREELRSFKSKQEEYDHRLSDQVLKQPLREAIDRCVTRLNGMETRLDKLEREMEANRTALDKKMETVLEVVKNENAQLRRAIEKLQKSTVSGGWEHTIKPGETLGVIAKEYGVRVKDIVEANDIKNPNRISVGQNLFIPRPGR